ncbi:MAG: ribonuclease domain-containing protein [Planctomycetaceae bacterium]
MSQSQPSRRQLIIRWAVFLAILGVVWVARRREPPRAEPADDAVAGARAEPAARGEKAGPVATAPSTPAPVEPRWSPPPSGPAGADDVDAAATARGPKAPAASAEAEPEAPAGRSKGGPRRGAPAGDGVVIEGLALRDAEGRTIYRGSIDLAPTLERIAAGKRLRFPNDGATFQNRERRLPGRPAGYYREWVVPTSGESGPGPQRLVTGEDGEVWYTPDHYRSFRRISTKALPR